MQRSTIGQSRGNVHNLANSMSEVHGYEWGLSQLQYVMKELGHLEDKARSENNLEFLSKVEASIAHAREAQGELRQKLKRGDVQ